MKKFFYTAFANLFYVIRHFLLSALLITAAAAAIMICIAAIKARKNGESIKSALKKETPAVCSASALVFYLSLLLEVTVLKRLSEPEYDPLSNIMGGWLIEELQYTYDFSPAWNVVMFLPLCAFIYLFLRFALKRIPDTKRLLIICGTSGFLFSAVLEILQILLKAGTFQFSDLFYNTLGAILGVPVYLVAKKIICKAHSAYRRKKLK